MARIAWGTRKKVIDKKFYGKKGNSPKKSKSNKNWMKLYPEPKRKTRLGG